MIPNKKIFILFIAILIFIVIFFFISKNKTQSEVILNGKTFSVEVVSSQSALERGLSGHKPLLENQGMLFIFPKPDNYGFWMKDMTFPIDIIWIKSSFEIIYIEKSLLPETYPKIFYPNSPALYVLEISAGISHKINLKIGDIVKFVKK